MFMPRAGAIWIVPNLTFRLSGPDTPGQYMTRTTYQDKLTGPPNRASSNGRELHRLHRNR